MTTSQLKLSEKMSNFKTKLNFQEQDEFITRVSHHDDLEETSKGDLTTAICMVTQLLLKRKGGDFDHTLDDLTKHCFEAQEGIESKKQRLYMSLLALMNLFTKPNICFRRAIKSTYFR